jgi:hypothetical protein
MHGGDFMDRRASRASVRRYTGTGRRPAESQATESSWPMTRWFDFVDHYFVTMWQRPADDLITLSAP